MFLPNKIRVEILLPLFDNEGNEVDKSKFFYIRKELAAEFKGCTFMSPTQGMWIDREEEEYIDANVGFYVLAPNTEKSTNFFKAYKAILKERFNQLDVLMTYYPVEIL